MDVIFAHSIAGRPQSFWEPLAEHLDIVGQLAAWFCQPFGSADWGRLAGLWHDMGKYRAEFQARIRGGREQVEHAGLGAALAESKHLRAGLPLAFAIAGHHAGLANHQSQGESQRTPLVVRLSGNRTVLNAIAGSLPATLADLPLPTPPDFLRGPGDRDTVMRRIELWTRFLFSALVDADRQATAAFYAKFDVAIRLHEELHYDQLATLRDRLDNFIEAKAATAGKEVAPTSVNSARAEILDACRAAASLPPGRFNLTVPTGGGKTLSGMSFALNHAVRHGLRRVIVVIPFTSIIEQNARVYRDVLGATNVIEHHSNLDEQKLAEENAEAEVRRTLAAENWDAPIVVTTTVQFFESLLSDHPSRCRKLHNIAQSVVVLDEVQTLPPQYLLTILDVLGELTDHYGCSVVLSTATPPALKRREDKHYGLNDVQDIIRDPEGLARRLERVRVTWPSPIEHSMSYMDLARRMGERDKVLAVVHRRQDAQQLAGLLPEKGRFHLSALMCPAHRLDTLARMREALKGEGPCRLVSTQLIEAGVDIDFPVVYRALAGLDSLAQAAGRCNREGNLKDVDGRPIPGEFVIFRAETDPPTPTLKMAMQSTLTLLAAHGPQLNPFDPRRCEEFFDNLYIKAALDAKGIQTDRANLNFATVAANFKLIDEDAVSVFVPYAKAGDSRLADYVAAPSRATRRGLQPFVVQIRRFHQKRMRDSGSLIPVDETLEQLSPVFHHLYDDTFGLSLEDRPADPAALIG
jgi:CRISPR-associated endonuclease/helicase Cas3